MFGAFAPGAVDLEGELADDCEGLGDEVKSWLRLESACGHGSRDLERRLARLVREFVVDLTEHDGEIF
jgi:hypothetical protein